MQLMVSGEFRISRFCLLLVFVFVFLAGRPVEAEEQNQPLPHFDGIDPNQMLDDYFEQGTTRIEQEFSLYKMNGESWSKNREKYRKQLAEMLGLSPLPERTALKATVTGEISDDDLIVRKLHYQSSPGLYVSANLYLPKKVEKPLPAVLYVCGHARRVKDGVSYGNKTGYHHHGIWFARNGYVCLIIDTIQLGELQGIHHGTYSKGMWWWNARGYTPAGVEAWNGIRAIDYLQSLPEVDGERIGVTGRSGGGAYSWWIAALDERIKVAVPVAGITSMRNHVVDGCIEGHCDCMYMVNSYGWDFPMVAALVAPRPLLVVNTDKDGIFPLDGVMEVYWQTRHIYEELKAGDKLGIAISEGPHKDTQRLQVNAFEWFNRFLKNENREDIEPSEKRYQMEQLKVFRELPKDERTTTIHHSFVPRANMILPDSFEQWEKQRARYKTALRNQTFRHWPNLKTTTASLDLKKLASTTNGKLKTTLYSFCPQAPFVLPVYVVEPVSPKHPDDRLTLYILGEEDWNDFKTGTLQQRIAAETGVTCFVPTRGIGSTAWSGNKKKQTQIRRRFALIGQTLDGMRVWDVRMALHAVRKIPQCEQKKIQLRARGVAADITLFASLFENNISELILQELSGSDSSEAVFLNVHKYLETPQVIAMAAGRCPVRLIDAPKQIAVYALQIQKLSGSTLKPIRTE